MKSLYLLLIVFIFCGNLLAETALTVNNVSETAQALPFESGDEPNGNSAANHNGDVFFILRNDDGSNSGVVTFTAQQTSKSVSGYGPLTKDDLAVTLTAGQQQIVGPFPARAWNNSSGLVILAFSGTASASISVATMRIP